jgi:hypothetical protein
MSVKGFKGFDQNFACRGHQFAPHATYTHQGDVRICARGFHFCIEPLDVFGFYDPAHARFAEVEAEDVSDQSDDDSKRVARVLRIGAEIGLSGIISAGVKFILERVDFTGAATNTGDSSAATNTGDRSAATNTGDRSAATNTGEEGCAIALGIEGKARGGLGCWLTLAEWAEIDGQWHRIDVQTRKVDGDQIKPDVFYQLRGGKFVALLAEDNA